MHKAMLFSRQDGELECNLCAHSCRIKEGRRGLCGVRENRGGDLITLVYGKLVAESVDPVEKKPLFHVAPGTLSYSISTQGCNFRCLHCQNASISQICSTESIRYRRISTPQEVIEAATAGGCRSISYTYVEPTIFFEFAYDCCKLAADRDIYNIFVSNGYMSDEASRLLAPVLTAINIDLKSYSDDFYRQVCGALLQPVLDSIRRMLELGVWVEVTTLVIPGKNDSSEELAKIAAFLAELDVNIPWHVTAFYPTYKMMDAPPTPRKTLQRAREIGVAAGLNFVYEGNIPGSGSESTACPSCEAVVVQRHGYTIIDNRLVDGRCHKCSTSLPGIWT